LERGETPAECDYLPTRFTTSGELGTEAWGDFQLDGYGAWLWGVAMHTQQVDGDVWKSLRPAVEMTVRYLGALWQSPNYDCWEENRQHVHTATLAAVYGGLRAVQNLDAALVPTGLPEKIRAFALRECVAQDGHFVKFIGDEAVDASLLWVALPYGLVDLHDEPFAKTLAKIERDLHYPGGGVYRYQADVYFGGGEWLLLTAWLAWVYVKLNRIDDARPLMRWIEAQAMPTGEFPEQVADHLLHPGHYDEWVQKWGTTACPLLWSHAMYLILEAALKDRG
jgi:GH15 family glucan-1,4-alpha-glucosidase